MYWAGVAALLLVLCPEALPQREANSRPFTAFGSPAQQRHRERQRQQQQQQQQQNSRQGAGRLLTNNVGAFPPRQQFQFGQPQFVQPQFGQQFGQQQFTTFPQSAPQQSAGLFRPTQAQFGQFRPVITSPGFPSFGRPAPPPPTQPPTPPPTTERPLRIRPRQRPTPKNVFSFRLAPRESTTTTTTTTTTTPLPSSFELNPTVRSNEVTVFEPDRGQTRFQFGRPATTEVPAQRQPTVGSFFNREPEFVTDAQPDDTITASPIEFQTESPVSFNTERPVNEQNFTDTDSLFDYVDEQDGGVDTFTDDAQYDYTDENGFVDESESGVDDSADFAEYVDTPGETFDTADFPPEVGAELTTARPVIELNRAQELAGGAGSADPEVTTVSAVVLDDLEVQTTDSPPQVTTLSDVFPTEAVVEVTELVETFSEDVTEPTVFNDTDDQELQELQSLDVAETTPVPTVAPTVSDEEFTTAITAPPTNRVTRETTPIAVRPTRPSIPRRGLSSAFRNRLQNRNRDGARGRPEAEAPEEASTTAAPAQADETSAPPRRLSLRERLLQATKSKAPASATTERSVTSTTAPSLSGRTASEEVADSKPQDAPATSGRRFSPPSRRPRPPSRSSGGARGGLASLLVKQLKDESPAPSSSATTTTTTKSTSTTTRTTTTEASEPSTTARQTPARGGLAAILSNKGSSDRSSRPGLSSLIERLRGRTSTTESTSSAEREGKAIRTDAERQRPSPSADRRRPSTTTESPASPSVSTIEVIEEDVSAFLPPGFKPVEDKVETTTLKSEGGLVIIEEDINPDFLPEGFKEKVRADLESSSDVPRLTPPPSTSRPKVDEVEDLTSFLPPGFQLSAVSTTTSENKPTIIEEDVSSFLPPGYKAPETTTAASVAVIEDEDVSAFLPPGYKPPTTKAARRAPPVIAIEEDVSAFLPPGYKPASETTTSRPGPSIVAIEEDVSAFLPPGYKPTTTEAPKRPPVIAIEEDVSAFLPPGYKPTEEATKPRRPPVLAVEEDVSAFLPPGYKPPASSTAKPKVAVVDEDVSAFLPPGYKAPEASTEAEEAAAEATTAKPRRKGGIVFPGGREVNRKPLDLSWLSTTTKTPPRPYQVQNSEEGLFSRLGDRPKFTGWPTEATTAPSGPPPTARSTPPTSTRETTTTTSTTTTTTRAPTTPGVCTANCRMVSSVRIVDGLQWRPELAIRGTEAWEDAADLVTLELTEAFQASKLNVWFDRVIIDSFSRGSVIADYYLVFNKLIGELDTRDVNVLFTESLPTTTVEMEDGEDHEFLRMGSLTIDPGFTDFVVEKPAEPVVEEEDNYLIPEWSIAVIVIGLTALLFMLIFGIVLMWNRRKRSTRGPRTSVPLTADMLNELDKSHMAGVDNYGADEVYDPDDAWNNEKVTYDRRLRSASREKSMDYKNYNIYDSWRSDMSGPHGSAAGWSRKKIDNFDDDPDDF